MEIDYNVLIKKAKGSEAEEYVSKHTFDDFGLDEHLVSNLRAKGYITPTPIQDKAIKVIMENRDIIGIANTGTGKTAAFLLPLIHKVYHNPKHCVLILAPTRELANQILAELKTFVNNSKVSLALVIGGESINRQIETLKKSRNFLVATPGRLLDLINQGAVRMEAFETVVLDEMDQMLDMGFIKDIRQILAAATNKKHLLFFSATITPNIEKIAGEILHNPVTVSVVQGRTADNVHQDIIELKENENKFDKLVEVLKREGVSKTIVFENTKHGATKIEKLLLKNGFKALAIHGNKNQNQRNRALQAFKDGSVDILIATNVAARGLDIDAVSHVINYSLPESTEDYVHRIGRTGRAGLIGHAITFVPFGSKKR